jgi:hypothetical protein
MQDRFHSSDYGLDELPTAGGGGKSSSSRAAAAGYNKPRPSDDGSPLPHGRRSREPLHAGAAELPRYQPGQQHLNPFDDASSVRSGNGSSYPPSERGQQQQQWPKRDSSHQQGPNGGKEGRL